MEIKSFLNRSSVSDFENALGQYLIYQSVLQIRASKLPLYLAIPSLVYERLFRKSVVQNVIVNNHIKLVVVDIELEEIIQWVE